MILRKNLRFNYERYKKQGISCFFATHICKGITGGFAPEGFLLEKQKEKLYNDKTEGKKETGIVNINKKTDPIGVFDSGVGGLTVTREIMRVASE